ncbi:hypothetical protein [Ornithinibacillus xuwenensis]|uniref:Uncharacterized protein n=1 Tax=Ornithinibacillus xuwenensis TaxID=3144668 RepID=A0ABU9XDX7_9BACI
MGMLTPQLIHKAKQNGINQETLRIRLSRGWDEERATTEPTEKKTERAKWLKVAIDNGINVVAFNSRVYSYGWDYEEAATRPLRKRSV